MKSKTHKREVRHKRVRGKVSGTAARPRLAVFRSNRFISAQLIDDEASVTLASAHGRDTKGTSLMKQAVAAGETIAKAATAKGITAVVFDRGGFTYAGRVKALAEAARAGGLKF
jgi:large subunit ribosomal protein L18